MTYLFPKPEIDSFLIYGCGTIVSYTSTHHVIKTFLPGRRASSFQGGKGVKLVSIDGAALFRDS